MINEITIDNIDKCINLLDPDIVDNLGREYFHGLFHEDDEEKCDGVIIWEIKNVKHPDDCYAEIAYFNVKDSRKAGIMLTAFSTVSTGYNIKRSVFEFKDLAPDLEQMFSSSGFKLSRRESRDLHLSLRELTELKFAKKKVPPYIVPISELSLLEFKKGISNCIFGGSNGLLEDLTTLPPSWYDRDISCAVRTDDKITGLFLIHRTSGNVFIPQLLFASGVDSQKDLLHMLSFSIKAASNMYSPDTQILIRRHDDKSQALTAYLFPNAKGYTITAGERRE